MPRPKTAPELRKADPELVAEIDRLLDHHTDGEIATQFNQRGILSPTGLPFKMELVSILRRRYGLKARSQRLREAGCMSLGELAAKLHVGMKKLKRWEAQGLLKSHASGENRRLWEVPTSIPSEEDS